MADRPQLALSCVHVSRLIEEPRWAAKRHAHPFSEMLVMLRGQMHVAVAGREPLVNAGDVLFYAPGTPHREWTSADGRAEFFCFALKGTPPESIGYLTHDLAGRVRALAHWLHEEQFLSYEDRQRAMDAYLLALLAELQKLARFKPRDPLEAVRAHLREHLNEAHSIADCARRAKMSKYHFIRAYKRSMGRTPMEDLRLVRVEAACDLLLTTDLPLKDIARRVGFCDEYYFSRVFRKYRDVPPGAFRGRK